MAALRTGIKNFRSHSLNPRVLNSVITPTSAEGTNQNTRKYYNGNKNTNGCKQPAEEPAASAPTFTEKKRRSQSSPPLQDWFVNGKDEDEKSRKIEKITAKSALIDAAVNAAKNTQKPHGVIPSIKHVARRLEHFLYSKKKKRSEDEIKPKSLIGQMKDGTSFAVNNCIKTITSLSLMDVSVTVPVPYIPEKALHIVEHNTKTVKSVPFSQITSKQLELLQLSNCDRIQFKNSQSSTKSGSLPVKSKSQNNIAKAEQENRNTVISGYSMFVRAKNNFDVMDLVNIIGNDSNNNNYYSLNNVKKNNKSNLRVNYVQKRHFQKSTKRLNDMEKKCWKNTKSSIKLNDRKTDFDEKEITNCNNINNNDGRNEAKKTENKSEKFEILSCESGNNENETFHSGLDRDPGRSKVDVTKIFNFFDNLIINKRTSRINYAVGELRRTCSENSLYQLFGGFFSFDVEKKCVSIPYNINNIGNNNNLICNNLYTQCCSSTSVTSHVSFCSGKKMLLKPYEEIRKGYSTANTVSSNSSVEQGIPNEVLHSVLTRYLNDPAQSKEQLSRRNSKHVFDTKTDSCDLSDNYNNSNNNNNHLNYGGNSTNSNLIFDTKITKNEPSNNLTFGLNEIANTKMDALLKNELNLKERKLPFNLSRPTDITGRKFDKNSSEAEDLTEIFVKQTCIDIKTDYSPVITEELKLRNDNIENETDNPLLTERNTDVKKDFGKDENFPETDQVKENRSMMMKLLSKRNPYLERDERVVIKMLNTFANTLDSNDQINDVSISKSQNLKENKETEKAANGAANTNFISSDPYTQRISERLKIDRIQSNNETVAHFLRKPKSFSDFGSKKTKHEQNIYLKYMISNNDKKENNVDSTRKDIVESISMTVMNKYSLSTEEDIKKNKDMFILPKEKKEVELYEAIEKELVPISKADNLSNKNDSIKPFDIKSENKNALYNCITQDFAIDSCNKNINYFNKFNEDHQQRSDFEIKIEECRDEIGNKYFKSKEIKGNIANEMELNKSSSKSIVKTIAPEDKVEEKKVSKDFEVEVSLSTKLVTKQVIIPHNKIENVKEDGEKLQGKDVKKLENCNSIATLDQLSEQSLKKNNLNIIDENKPSKVVSNEKEAGTENVVENYKKIVDKMDVENKSWNNEMKLTTASPVNYNVVPSMDIILERLNELHKEYEKKHAEDIIEKSKDPVLNSEQIGNNHKRNLSDFKRAQYNSINESVNYNKNSNFSMKKTNNSVEEYFAKNNAMYLNDKYSKKKEKIYARDDNNKKSVAGKEISLLKNKIMSTSKQNQLEEIGSQKEYDKKSPLNMKENIEGSDKIETKTAGEQIKLSDNENSVYERNNLECQINVAGKTDVANKEKYVLQEKPVVNKEKEDKPETGSIFLESEDGVLKGNKKTVESATKNYESKIVNASSVKNTDDSENFKSEHQNKEKTTVILSEGNKNTTVLPANPNEFKSLSETILEKKREMLKKSKKKDNKLNNDDDADDEDEYGTNIVRMKGSNLFAKEITALKNQPDTINLRKLNQSSMNISPSEYNKLVNDKYQIRPEKGRITYEDVKKLVHQEAKENNEGLEKKIKINKKQFEDTGLKVNEGAAAEENHTSMASDIDANSILAENTKTDYGPSQSFGLKTIIDKPSDEPEDRLSTLLLLSEKTRKLIRTIKTKQNSINESIDNLAAKSYENFRQNVANPGLHQPSVTLSPTIRSGWPTPEKQTIEKVEPIEYKSKSHTNRIQTELEKEEIRKELVKKELKIDDAKTKSSSDKTDDDGFKDYIKETRNKESDGIVIGGKKFKESFKNLTELPSLKSGNTNNNRSNSNMVNLKKKKFSENEAHVNKFAEKLLGPPIADKLKPVYKYNTATEKINNLKNKVMAKEKEKEIQRYRKSIEKDKSHYDFSAKLSRGENNFGVGSKPKLDYSAGEKSSNNKQEENNPVNFSAFDQFHTNIKQRLSDQYKKTDFSDKNLRYKINPNDKFPDRRSGINNNLSDQASDKITTNKNLTGKGNLKKFAIENRKKFNQDQSGNEFNQSETIKNVKIQKINEPAGKPSKIYFVDKSPGKDDMDSNKINFTPMNGKVDQMSSVKSTKSSKKSAKASSSNVTTAKTDEGSAVSGFINSLKDKTYKLFSSTSIVSHFTNKKNEHNLSTNETYRYKPVLNSLKDVNNPIGKAGGNRKDKDYNIITDHSKYNKKENNTSSKLNVESKKSLSDTYKNRNNKLVEGKSGVNKEGIKIVVKYTPNSSQKGGSIKYQPSKSTDQRFKNKYNNRIKVDKKKYKSTNNEFTILKKTEEANPSPPASNSPQTATTRTQIPSLTYYSSKYMDTSIKPKQDELISDKRKWLATKKVEMWASKNSAGSSYVDYSKSIDRSNDEYLNNLVDGIGTTNYLPQKTGVYGRNKIGAGKIAIKTRIPTAAKDDKLTNAANKNNDFINFGSYVNSLETIKETGYMKMANSRSANKKSDIDTITERQLKHINSTIIPRSEQMEREDIVKHFKTNKVLVTPSIISQRPKKTMRSPQTTVRLSSANSISPWKYRNALTRSNKSFNKPSIKVHPTFKKQKLTKLYDLYNNDRSINLTKSSAKGLKVGNSAVKSNAYENHQISFTGGMKNLTGSNVARTYSNSASPRTKQKISNPAFNFFNNNNNSGNNDDDGNDNDENTKMIKYFKRDRMSKDGLIEVKRRPLSTTSIKRNINTRSHLPRYTRYPSVTDNKIRNSITDIGDFSPKRNTREHINQRYVTPEFKNLLLKNKKSFDVVEPVSRRPYTPVTTSTYNASFGLKLNKY